MEKSVDIYIYRERERGREREREKKELGEGDQFSTYRERYEVIDLLPYFLKVFMKQGVL